MNKEELLSSIQESTNASRSTIDSILRAFMETVSRALQEGDDVRLVGFGTFKTQNRAETTGRNPRTGEAIKIAASIRPKFVAGKAFIDAMSQTGSKDKDSKKAKASNNKSDNKKTNDKQSDKFDKANNNRK